MFKTDTVSLVARNKFIQVSLGLGMAVVFLGGSAVASPQVNRDISSQKATATPNNLPAVGSDRTNPATRASSVNPNNPNVNPVENVRLVLKLKERRLYVYKGDKVSVKYPVAVGKPGWETPTGSFKVIQMIKDPAWAHPFKEGVVLPPGPQNPLGRRWVAFWTDGTNAIGFHGTPNESVMGRAVSHGCVRMRNKDVIALYELVSLGTSVTVEP